MPTYFEVPPYTRDAHTTKVSLKYQLFGKLWLDDLEEHLNSQDFDRLKDLEPQFRALKARTRPCK